MGDSWKNIGLVVCMVLIIMLMPNYAQAKSKMEEKGIPEINIFREDDGFGIWNLVVRTREGRLLLCYEDGRNLEVMKDASNLVQSIINRNSEYKDGTNIGEITVIGHYDSKNDVLNLNQIICVESIKGQKPQEVVIDTDYQDETAAFHNDYVIFDEVTALYKPSENQQTLYTVGVPLWWSFWVGNFGVNYCWPDPWGICHYWRGPNIVFYYWDGLYYWREPYFRRPYWRYHCFRPWYWRGLYWYRRYWPYRTRRWYWGYPYRYWRYGYYWENRYRYWAGPYSDCPDRKENSNKHWKSSKNPHLRSHRSLPPQRKSSVKTRSSFSRPTRTIVRGFRESARGFIIQTFRKGNSNKHWQSNRGSHLKSHRSLSTQRKSSVRTRSSFSRPTRTIVRGFSGGFRGGR